MACKLVLCWQAEGSSLHRARLPALLLTAASAWILNGLHSTPDTGYSSKELMNATLPHVNRREADPDTLAYGGPAAHDDGDSQASSDSEEEQPARRRRRGAETLPAFPYGLVFLRGIRVGPEYPVPRLTHDGSYIESKAFRYFFGVNSDEIELEFFASRLVAPPNPARVPNKAPRTARYHNWNRGEGEEERDFSLADQGYRLNPTPRDGGSDIDDNEDRDNDDEAEGEEDEAAFNERIDKLLTRVWRQFLLDITLKSPNMRRAVNPSYCILDPGERTLVTEETYKNRRLSDYFLDCQWKFAESGDWDLTFDRLWPLGDSLQNKSQNYTATTYYPEWAALKARADSDTIQHMRRALKKKFDKLYWMPFAQSDRIWYTKAAIGFQKSSGRNILAPAPQILINGPRPLW